MPKIRPKKKFLKNWIFDTLFGLKKHPCQIFIYYAKKLFVSVGIESLYGFNDFSALSCQKFGQKKSFLKNWIFDTLFGLKKHPCQIFIYYAKKVFVSVGIESLYGFNDFSALSCQKFGQKKSFLKNWIFDTLFGLKKHPCQIFIYYAKKVFVSVGIESLYGFNDFSALSCQKFGQKKSFWKIEFLTRYLA